MEDGMIVSRRKFFIKERVFEFMLFCFGWGSREKRGKIREKEGGGFYRRKGKIRRKKGIFLFLSRIGFSMK